MSSTRRSYTEAFKRSAVERYAWGIQSMAEIERDLYITSGQLSKWRTQYLPELLTTTPEMAGLRLALPLSQQEGVDDPRARILATSSATILWRQPPIDNLDWIQFYGHTQYAGQIRRYPSSCDVHTGIDWGRSDQAFATGQQVSVFARCRGVVVAAKAVPLDKPYAPGVVDIKPDAYPDLTLKYGHLQQIQVGVGSTVDENSLLGFLNAEEGHVHVEIRRSDGVTYINPYPFMSPGLKQLLYRRRRTSAGTTYDEFQSNPIPRSGEYGVPCE